MEVRGRIKCANTSTAKKLLVGKLERFRKQGYSITDILEEATEKSWKSVYEPKEMPSRVNTDMDPEDQRKLEKWRKDRALKQGTNLS